METLLLTCLQAQLIMSRVNTYQGISPQIRNDIIWELRQVTKKECKIDAKAD